MWRPCISPLELTQLGWNDDYIDTIRDDPSRTLMGARQENWFYRSLSESKKRGATWRLVGNQIIFSRIFDNEEGDMSTDNWNVSRCSGCPFDLLNWG